MAAARHKGENVTHVDERANRSSKQSGSSDNSPANEVRLPEKQP